MDPVTGAVSRETVTVTNHDMFCPGISMLSNGNYVVSGGNDASVVSIYSPANDQWIRAADMNIARGYQSSVTLGNNEVICALASVPHE